MNDTTIKKRTLLEITRDYTMILHTIDENDGVIEEDLLEEMLLVEGEFSHKVEACLSVAESLDAKAAAEKARAKKINEHARAIGNEAKRIRDRLVDSMQAADMTRIETASFTASIRKVPPSVDLDIVEFLSWAASKERTDLLRQKDPEPDKTKIKAALKSGEKIHGARLRTDGKRLHVQ